MVLFQMLKLSARKNCGGKHVYFLYLIIERLIVCKILYCIFSQTSTAKSVLIMIIIIINVLVDFVIRLVIFVLNLPDGQITEGL